MPATAGKPAAAGFKALLHPPGPLGQAEDADDDGPAGSGQSGAYGHDGHGRHGPGGKLEGLAEGPDGHRPRKALEPTAPLDAAARHAAHLAPPPMAGAPCAAPVEAGAEAVATRARTSLEDLLPSLVRKVAWSGDGRRGVVHLELGGGPLAGGTLVIHADEGRVRVHLRAPQGEGGEGWRERIAARLAARGLAVDAVEVE